MAGEGLSASFEQSLLLSCLKLHPQYFVPLALVALLSNTNQYPAFKEEMKFCVGLKNFNLRNFPGSPVAKTLCSQGRGPGFDP